MTLTRKTIVTGIVRHKKSNKLVYKFWNHHTFDSEPTDPTFFDYINVDYAVINCKWSKYRLVLSHIATAVAAEDEYRNRGPSRNSVKKAKQRKRYTQWYHKL